MTSATTPATPAPHTGTLLGVWAHPDDEAYLSAGLMAAARERGDRVVVVTATAGEHGTDDPARWPPGRLARRRRREMARSLAALGVHEHHWLGYRDGGCPDVSEATAVRDLGRIAAAVRPDTIVTFGPDGMTGHPDHCAVSAWTTAVWRAGGSAARLWYATLLPSFHDQWGSLNESAGLFPAPPPETAEHDTAAVVYCRGRVAERKAAALRAHASQVRPLLDLVGGATFDRWWSVEAFVDARTLSAQPVASSRRTSAIPSTVAPQLVP